MRIYLYYITAYHIINGTNSLSLVLFDLLLLSRDVLWLWLVPSQLVVVVVVVVVVVIFVGHYHCREKTDEIIVVWHYCVNKHATQIIQHTDSSRGDGLFDRKICCHGR